MSSLMVQMNLKGAGRAARPSSAWRVSWKTVMVAVLFGRFPIAEFEGDILVVVEDGDAVGFRGHDGGCHCAR